MTKVYVSVHRRCDHAIGAAGTRQEAGDIPSHLGLPAAQFRVRVASDEDLLALLAGRRCESCTLDGQVIS